MSGRRTLRVELTPAQLRIVRMALNRWTNDPGDALPRRHEAETIAEVRNALDAARSAPEVPLPALRGISKALSIHEAAMQGEEENLGPREAENHAAATAWFQRAAGAIGWRRVFPELRKRGAP